MFHFLALVALPLRQISLKREIIYYPPRPTILQNFSPITQTMYEICVTKVFHFLALIFDPSGSCKVKCDRENRKPMGPTYKCSLGYNLVSVTVFEIFPVKILTLLWLTPGPTFTRKRDDLLPT